MKKRGKRRIIFWLILIGLLVVAFIYRKQVIRYSYKAYRYYRALTRKNVPYGKFVPIDFPLGYNVHGVDVSRWQDEINWNKLKTVSTDGDTIKFRFAFIKATEGILLEDPLFDDNWHAAKECKIPRGAYHYFLPGQDAKLQAKNFITSVDLAKGDLPPVIDVEEIRKKNKKELVQRLKIFIAEIEKHYKVRPLLYSNISFIEDYLADDFSDYNFWIAHYYEEELHVESGIDWLFWQHSDRAWVFGCHYPVDANVFNGNMADFRKILIK